RYSALIFHYFFNPSAPCYIYTLSLHDALPIYIEELKYMFTEDYHKEMETLLTFDSTIEVDIERPDESVDTPTLKTAHYAILVDASGSMAAKVGGKTRMEAAKEAVLEFAEQIPENATLSLR